MGNAECGMQNAECGIDNERSCPFGYIRPRTVDHSPLTTDGCALSNAWRSSGTTLRQMEIVGHAVPRSIYGTFCIGRSSDFRAARRHSLLAGAVGIAFAIVDCRGNGLPENDVRYRSVTAAGPSRVCTGVPCLSAGNKQLPTDHQRTKNNLTRNLVTARPGPKIFRTR